MNPNAQAIVAVNPHSAHRRCHARQRRHARCRRCRTGGIISGQAAVINLNGTTPREMALVPSAALVINFPTRERGRRRRLRRVVGAQPDLTDAITHARPAHRHHCAKCSATPKPTDARRTLTHATRKLPRPDTDIVLASLVPLRARRASRDFRADRERRFAPPSASPTR